jgi:outer membrane protein insertion porin family
MTEPRIERSENRLKNLQYFKTVRHYSEQTDKPGVRDLVYDVEEQRTGNFMVGAGVSSVDNVVGFLEITQSNFDIFNWPNFTGGGQKARLGLEAGSRRQTAEVSWTEPWFLDRPLALTVRWTTWRAATGTRTRTTSRSKPAISIRISNIRSTCTATI